MLMTRYVRNMPFHGVIPTVYARYDVPDKAQAKGKVSYLGV
jgi:hypothetical protein